jgi:C4-dicarboxylate-specific signal transduction histidine kinase
MKASPQENTVKILPVSRGRDAAQCAAGCLVIGLITLVCFRLGLNFATPTFLYLMVIVGLSLRGSFISAAVASLVAVTCLTFFFIKPIYSFRVSDPIDVVAVVAFLTTAGVITRLVAQVRQLMQEKLQRSETYLSYAQRLSHTGSFGWKVGALEISWSEETFRIFQVEPGTQPTMELVLQRVHPEDRELVKQTIEQAARAAEDFNFEHRLVAPDGGIKHVHVVAHARKDGAGTLEFVGAVMDVTASKAAAAALRQEQLKLAHVARLTTVGELTASIAHEVNQPLAAVVLNGNACLRWLDREVPDLNEAREAVRRIIRDGNRGSAVIARIRALLKREPQEKVALDVNQVVQETLALARVDLQGAAVQVELGKSLPRVNADRVQLQQVLLNLTVNAMDAMKPVTDRPRVLRVLTQRQGTQGDQGVLVVVQDSGVGLDAKQKEQVFETFHTTKPDGLGMGLSICRSIIEGHGGRLWAESPEGPGARFQFTLPAAEGGAA